MPLDTAPVPDSQAQDDFLASRGAASAQAAIANLDRLLTGSSPPASSQSGAGTAGAAPGRSGGGSDLPAAAAAPDTRGLPFGRAIEQAAQDRAAPASEAPLGDRLRALVEPRPGEEVGSVLPLARDAQGNVRFTAPDLIRSVVRGFAGFADRLEGRTPGLAPLNQDELGALMTVAGTGDLKFGGAAGEGAAASAATNAGESLATAAAKEAEPKAAAPAAPSKPFNLVTDGKPSVEVTPEIRQNAVDFLHGVTGENPVQASLSQIADPKVMDEAIQGVASFLPKNDVVPDEVIRQAAYSIALQPEDIARLGAEGSKLAGALPDATQTAAHAMLVNSGAEQFGALARKAVETGAQEDWEAAIRAFALQSKIVGDWQDAGNEMGRAFRMRQIAQEARSDYSAAVQNIIKSAGPDNVEQAIRQAAALQTPQQVSGFTGALRWIGTRRGMLSVWYNYLLGPLTVSKKLATDALFPAWNLATRYTAEIGGQIGLGSGAVPEGETAQLLYGYLASVGDAVRAAGRGLMAGRSQYASEFSTMDGLSRLRVQELAKAAQAPLEDPGTAGGSAIGNALKAAAPILRAFLPTSWLAGADDFGYLLNYRAELRALAYRDGVSKLMTAGGEADSEAIGAHIAEQMANPKPALHSAADAAARSNIFADPLTGNAAKFSDWIDSLELPIAGTNVRVPYGRMLVPFTTRPVNFLRWLYRQSPLPIAFPSDAFKADLAAGGASRDLAFAKIGLGTALGGIVTALAAGGLIDGAGPTDPKLREPWRDAGHVPYSIRIGGRAVTLPVEPFSRILGAAADAVDAMRYAKDDDLEDLAGSVVFGFGHAFVSTTYMQDLSRFMEAVMNQRDARHFIGDLVTSLTMPRTAQQLAGMIDPWLRAHYGLLDAIWAKTPWVSKSLPPDRNVWGDPIPLRDAFARVVIPFQLGPDTTEPIDQWRWDHRSDFADGNASIPKLQRTLTWQQDSLKAHYQLTPEQYDRAQYLAGNGLKEPRSGLGLKDTLNAVVQGDGPARLQAEWNQASDAERALMVQRLVSDYRTETKRQLLREYPEIAESVQAQFGARREQLRPSSGPTAPAATGGISSSAPRMAPALE